MLTFAQILIDIILILAVLVLASAHVANRATGAEIDGIKDWVTQELDKLWGDVRDRFTEAKKDAQAKIDAEVKTGPQP